MATNYRFGYNGNPVDFDDYFVRLDLFATGNLWGWGENGYGELGNNSTTDRSSPAQTVSGGNNWIEISSGFNHSAGIKSDGVLWSWGNNAYGQLGDNSILNRITPVETVAGGNTWKQVACGYWHSCGIKVDGTLWTWGRNDFGELGDNTTVPKSSAVQTTSGGYNWKECDAGGEFAAAIKTDGTLWTWGYNTAGILGLGDSVHRSQPTQVGTSSSWKSISCGRTHMAGLKTDGTLWCWGFGNVGQLGNNSTSDSNVPVETNAGGTNWKKVRCGDFHTMGIKTDGSLWLWGLNGYGQLGDNSTTNKSIPVETISQGKVWKDVSGGEDSTSAIKIDGTLWSWGRNNVGQLANNNNLVTQTSSPVISAMFDSYWKSVASGRNHAFAIRYLDAP